jgi:chromatin segregation and condensation protein Rec8/ScpA/Scc1 (kleisin family)
MHKIEIDDFSGPLDLLLTLVQQEEISLVQIKIIEILDQLIAGLNSDIDLNESGDAIIVISTLLELKTKLLLPDEVDISEEIESLKEDLLTKILVHRRLSQVLDALEYRMDRRVQMHERPMQLVEKEMVMLPMELQNPFTLFSSLSLLLESARQDSFRVDYVILPVEHYYKWLDSDYKGKDFELREIAKYRKDPLDFSGVLIAVLELIRQYVLVFEKDGLNINLSWRDTEKPFSFEVETIESIE